MKLSKRRSEIVIPIVCAVFAAIISVTLWTIITTRSLTEPKHTVVAQKDPEKAEPKPVLPKAEKPVSIAPDVHLPVVTDGVAPVVYRVATNEKVVFLGIDDGAYKNQEVVDLMKQYNIRASLYLSDAFIHSDPAFFKDVTAATGSVVENHSIHHDTKMSTKSYDYQKDEICSMADLDEQYYGRRPIFFRPPGGAYTLATQQAAAACGMKAVVTWIAKANGGSMQYQIGNGLRPGDVVLMHFRPEFKSDLKAFVDAETAAGLHTELLEDWL